MVILKWLIICILLVFAALLYARKHDLFGLLVVLAFALAIVL